MDARDGGPVASGRLPPTASSRSPNDDDSLRPPPAGTDQLIAELGPRGSRRWLVRALLTTAAFPTMLLQACARTPERDRADTPAPLSPATARFVNGSAEVVLEGRARAVGVDIAASLATLLGHADPKTGELILEFVESARLLAPLYGGARFCVDARESRVALLRTLAVAVSATCEICFYGDPLALRYLTDQARSRPRNERGATG